MNRLFIIGNGFDLAQGLPTSYNDFINDFWMNIGTNYEDEIIKKLVYINPSQFGFLNLREINRFEDFLCNIENHSKEYRGFYDEGKKEYYTDRSKNELVFKFESELFKDINDKKSLKNWVDIENEYYSKLKTVAKLSVKSPELAKSKVVKLNQEFQDIKILLEKYLFDKVVNNYDINSPKGNNNWIKIYEILRPISLYNNEVNLLQQFNHKEDVEEIKAIFDNQKSKDYSNKNLPFSLFLNFNYTPTIDLYSKELDLSSKSYIHGNLNDVNNRINFGFGDEMDKDYKAIEDVNDNEYLKFFKSFQYSETKNYNELLSYINSGKFQVCVLGHSCGLSDRTLLNTVFEHNNCRSIKVFYYEKDDVDNYRDIIQNISRHFDDKKKMREKIVPKVLCEPFPQDFIFQERS